ncbi:MAG TPA: DUF1772 domain-containing protein [Gemmatimonadaceae bacterium]|nr:DUF1772 domain-containing protein [Gemmatimonadaceae bacterium]
MAPVTIARVIAVAGAGMYAGILLGDLAGAAQARPQLPAASFVQLQQIIHARFAFMMPVIIVATLVACVAWMVLVRPHRRDAEFWLVAGTAAGLVLCAIITWLVNVPLNDQLVKWSVAFPPPNAHELWAPWEGAHAIRTVIAVVAFGLAVVALALAAPPLAERAALSDDAPG